nr:hypothetical protein [Cohnella luojiensis]
MFLRRRHTLSMSYNADSAIEKPPAPRAAASGNRYRDQRVEHVEDAYPLLVRVDFAAFQAERIAAAIHSLVVKQRVIHFAYS